MQTRSEEPGSHGRNRNGGEHHHRADNTDEFRRKRPHNFLIRVLSAHVLGSASASVRVCNRAIPFSFVCTIIPRGVTVTAV